jgi:hypothetical protein
MATISLERHIQEISVDGVVPDIDVIHLQTMIVEELRHRDPKAPQDLLELEAGEHTQHYLPLIGKELDRINNNVVEQLGLSQSEISLGAIQDLKGGTTHNFKLTYLINGKPVSYVAKFAFLPSSAFSENVAINSRQHVLKECLILEQLEMESIDFPSPKVLSKGGAASQLNPGISGFKDLLGGDSPFAIIEYVNGENFVDYNFESSENRLLKLVHTAQALDFLVSKGIYKMDLKLSDSVMLDDETQDPRFLDFASDWFSAASVNNLFLKEITVNELNRLIGASGPTFVEYSAIASDIVSNSSSMEIETQADLWLAIHTELAFYNFKVNLLSLLLGDGDDLWKQKSKAEEFNKQYNMLFRFLGGDTSLSEDSKANCASFLQGKLQTDTNLEGSLPGVHKRLYNLSRKDDYQQPFSAALSLFEPLLAAS